MRQKATYPRPNVLPPGVQAFGKIKRIRARCASSLPFDCLVLAILVYIDIVNGRIRK